MKVYSKIKQLLPFGIIILCCVLLSRTLWTNQLPRTDDGELHGARLANYYLAIKQGQIPPQWAPNLNYGFGNPMFLFSYPLPYITATFFYALGASIELSWNLMIILSIFLIGIGWYLLSYLHTRSQFHSVIIACLLLTTPYYLVNIFVRGAMGEILFAGLVPWVLLGIELSLINKNHRRNLLLLSLLFIFILLSHQVLGPFFVLFSCIYTATRIQSKKISSSSQVFFFSVIIALLSTSFFYLPAFLEKSLIRLESNESVANFDRAFVPVSDIIWSNWNYGGKDGTIGQKFSRMVGPLLVFSILFLVKSIVKKRLTSTHLFLCITIVCSLFLMTEYSKFIWDIFTFLRLMQFPWRLLQLAILSSGLLFILSLKKENQTLAIKGAFFVFTTIWVSYTLLQWAKPISYISNSNHDWLEYGMLGDASGEFLPTNFDQHKNYAETDQVVVIERVDDQTQEIQKTDTQASIIEWTGSTKSYTINTSRSIDVLEKTMYFPGWSVRVDGQEYPILSEYRFFPGRIVYQLEPGEHKIETTWSKPTLDRNIGYFLTVIGGSMLFIITLLEIKKIFKFTKHS